MTKQRLPARRMNSTITCFLRRTLSGLLVAWLFGMGPALMAQTADLDSMRQQLPRVTNEQDRIALLHELAFGYHQVNPAYMLVYARQALQLSQKRKDWFAVSRSYNLIGVHYDVTGDYPQALHYYYRALPFAEKARSIRMQGTLYNNIGEVNQQMGNYPLSLDLFYQSLAFRQQMGQPGERYLPSLYNSIGKSYLEQGQYTSARKAYEQALQWSNKHPDTEDQAGIYLSFSSLNREFAQYTQSLAMAAKAYRLAGLLGNQRLLADALDHMAVAYGQLGRFSLASQCLKKAILLADSLKAPDFKARMLQHSSQLAQLQGQFPAALSLLKAHQALKDSLLSAVKAEQISRLKTLYELQGKERQNRLLRLNQEKSRALIRQQYWTVGIVSVGLLLFAGLSVVLLRFSRGQRKANALLQRQQFTITEQNHDLAQLNEEITQQSNVLCKQNQQLEQLNQMKDKFLSIISHDVRSPLNSLKGTLDLLRMEVISPAESRALTNKLSDQVQQTSLLLDNLLEWTLSQMQGIQVRPTEIDLRELAGETCRLYAPLAEDKGIQLTNTIREPISVFADAAMIQTVIRNLLNNAVKFSQVGDRIQVGACRQADAVLFWVQDTGVGISPEHQSKLFGMNSQHTLGTNQEKGTGVGLKLCRGFVEQNKGMIWVESLLKEGTTFFFTLPLSVHSRASTLDVLLAIEANR